MLVAGESPDEELASAAARPVVAGPPRGETESGAEKENGRQRRKKKKNKKELALGAVRNGPAHPTDCITLRPINEPAHALRSSRTLLVRCSLAEGQGKLGAAGCHDASLTAVHRAAGAGAAPSWMPPASPPPGAAPYARSVLVQNSVCNEKRCEELNSSWIVNL